MDKIFDFTPVCNPKQISIDFSAYTAFNFRAKKKYEIHL